MLCPPCWACLSLAAGLVSHLVFQLVCVRLPGLVSQLVFGLSSQLVSHVVFHLVWDAVLPAGLGSCVRALGLSPKFHVRFVQLFGVYGGVIFNILWFVLYVLIICFFCICMCDYSVCVCECTCTYVYMQLYVFVCCLHISACILMHPYVYLCHGSFCVFLRLGPRVFYVSLRGFMHLMYPYHSLCVSMYLDVCLLCLWVFLCLYIATACKCWSVYYIFVMMNQGILCASGKCGFVWKNRRKCIEFFSHIFELRCRSWMSSAKAF